MRCENLIGKKFSRLFVKAYSCKKGKKHYWECQCDCGRSHIVESSNLKNGSVKSCGCFRIDQTIKANRKYGRENRSICNVFYNMKNRCYNSKSKHYKNYGGRGIKIYDKWLQNLNNFIDWCNKNGYEKGLEIDRIDNDGNYSPDNCRFVTHKKNNENVRLLRVTNKSGFRGVSWSKQHKKWIAQIYLKGKRTFLGLYDNPVNAAIKYDKVVVTSGENRPINFSDNRI